MPTAVHLPIPIDQYRRIHRKIGPAPDKIRNQISSELAKSDRLLHHPAQSNFRLSIFQAFHRSRHRRGFDGFSPRPGKICRKFFVESKTDRSNWKQKSFEKQLRKFYRQKSGRDSMIREMKKTEWKVSRLEPVTFSLTRPRLTSVLDQLETGSKLTQKISVNFEIQTPLASLGSSPSKTKWRVLVQCYM